MNCVCLVVFKELQPQRLPRGTQGIVHTSLLGILLLFVFIAVCRRHPTSRNNQIFNIFISYHSFYFSAYPGVELSTGVCISK